MGNCNTCSTKDSCSQKGKNNSSGCGKLSIKYGKINNIIGVLSGKGGVGKSTVTGILATELNKAGYKVGVLDADITGPSMPRFFGVDEKRANIIQKPNSEEVIFKPVETKLGIKLMSLNLLIENEEDPVVWRGPVINGVLNQMYGDTEWGELDYLLIDMPPGTGDVTLTVMQSLPVTSLVVVSTPQDMVSMIVKKVIKMAEKLNLDVLGVVENMSYVLCGCCGQKTKVFSNKDPKEYADYLGTPLLAEMPIDLELVENLQNKTAEEYVNNSDKYHELYVSFMEKQK